MASSTNTNPVVRTRVAQGALNGRAAGGCSAWGGEDGGARAGRRREQQQQQPQFAGFRPFLLWGKERGGRASAGCCFGGVAEEAPRGLEGARFVSATGGRGGSRGTLGSELAVFPRLGGKAGGEGSVPGGEVSSPKHLTCYGSGRNRLFPQTIGIGNEWLKSTFNS